MRGYEILGAGIISYLGLLAVGLALWAAARLIVLVSGPAGWVWRRLDHFLVHRVSLVAGLGFKERIKRWPLFFAAFLALGFSAAVAPLWIAVLSIAVATALAFAVYRRWQGAEREYLDQVPDWQRKIHGEQALLLETIFATALIFFYAPIGFARLAEVDAAAFKPVETSVVVQEELGPLKPVVSGWDEASKLLPGQGIAEVALYTWAQALKGLPIIDYAEIYGVELAPLKPGNDNARHATMVMRALLDLLLLATIGQVLAIRANIRAGRDTREIEAALDRGGLSRIKRVAKDVEAFGLKAIIRPAELAARVCASADGLKQIRRQQRRGIARFSLAFAVLSVAGRNGLPGLLRDAVAAHRLTLKEWTRERVPLDWAMTQNNLGTALSDLGHMRGDEKLIEEAIAAYREALKERTRERVPLDWAMTQNNLGTALLRLGRIREDASLALEAIACFEGALSVYQQLNRPREAEETARSLTEARALLHEMKGGDQRTEVVAASKRSGQATHPGRTQQAFDAGMHRTRPDAWSDFLAELERRRAGGCDARDLRSNGRAE